jgi:protein TonB
MRNDIYVGVLVSVALHCGLAFINRSSIPVTVPTTIEEKVIRLVQRPEEFEEPPSEVSDEKPAPQETVARPTLEDFPSAVKIDDFTVPVQPPMPETAKIDRGLITIPPGNSGVHGAGSKIFNLADLERAPLARFQAAPEYPFEMKRNGVAGDVLVEFIVDANGAVRDAHAVRSSQREFEASAVRAVSKWTFRPGQKGGRNVATRMQVPIIFSLNEGRE